jgi:hypothetical protein
MIPQEIAALEAQVNALDRETARRVARLVLECRVSIPLALSAVEDAKSTPQPRTDRRFARVLAYIGALPWESTR